MRKLRIRIRKNKGNHHISCSWDEVKLDPQNPNGYSTTPADYELSVETDPQHSHVFNICAKHLYEFQNQLNEQISLRNTYKGG